MDKNVSEALVKFLNTLTKLAEKATAVIEKEEKKHG